MSGRNDAIDDSSEPAPLTRTRSLSNSSTETASSDDSVTSATAIVKKTPETYGSSAQGSHEDHHDQDGAHSPRLSDVSDISPADRPREVTERKRNWKRILLWTVPPVVVVIALALSLGLYFGLREDRDPNLIKGPVVDLGYSRYQGLALTNGVNEFRRMRYASPPLGDLRWRAPVAPQNETKIQDAQKWGSFCLGLDQTPGGPDEDCLFINVWAPSNATVASKLPVMVFIQGGGYIINSNPYANGSQLVENSGRNMVFVSFNYRVSVWGFLAGDDVKADGVLNAGLLDQRRALHWVQDNIHRFGGDEDHVVLQGVSAGAGSVGLHLAAYGGRNDNLFVGAIAESTFWPGQPHYKDVDYKYQRILNETDCLGHEDGNMACLRAKSTADIQDANHNEPFVGRLGNPNFYWMPVTDGDFMVDTPTNLFARGDFVKVPLLYGSTTNDGTIFTPNATSPYYFTTFMKNNFPYMTANDTDAMLDHYPLEPAFPMHADWYGPAARACGESTFICPANYILNSMRSASKTDIFSYRYNLQDYNFIDTGRGVPHTLESTAVFGAFMTATPASYTTYNAPIIPVVQNYWISFVRSLNPNTYRYKDAPEWKPWGDTQTRIVLQLPNSTMEDVPRNETQRCAFWRSINETMTQ
ncbi:Alpha/Beta hydrolase protein [Thelonectria olida]|uniref:Carboxylic ester hydrolase n=1 Tax=Thelonectria olida TaxID=1576542 RepID=A0A9P9ASJ2_9HYPO|nr:Alpha/Beta hydrolase protein [Thelonectria olida]